MQILRGIEATIEFESKHGNRYLYDFNHNVGILIHPLLSKVIKNRGERCIDDRDWDLYYQKKYHFLQKYGWFEDYSFEKNVSKQLTEQDVINQVANTEQLTFEVTENCNLNCLYCGFGELYSHHAKRGFRNLNFNTAVLIIDYCFSLWNSEKNRSKRRNIYIGFYGGEPLLNFKIIEQIVHYVQNKDVYKRIRFAMTTNSILLDRYMDFLVDNKFHLLLSLDGNSSNNVYRRKKNGDTSFELVCKNIDKLYKKYPIYFNQYVNFNAVLHNANSVEDIYNFIKTKYDKIPQISELNTYGIVKQKRKDFDRMFVNCERSIMSSVDRQELVKNLFISIPFYKDLSRFVLQYFGIKKELHHFIKRTNQVHIPTGTCIPFAKKFFVSVAGEFFPCETIHRNHPLGRVMNGKVELDFTGIISYYNELYLLIRKQCEKCYFQRSCVQCLFNMSSKQKRIYCKTSMDKVKFANYLSDEIGILEENSSLLNKIIDQIYLK